MGALLAASCLSRYALLEGVRKCRLLLALILLAALALFGYNGLTGYFLFSQAIPPSEVSGAISDKDLVSLQDGVFADLGFENQTIFSATFEVASSGNYLLALGAYCNDSLGLRIFHHSDCIYDSGLESRVEVPLELSEGNHTFEFYVEQHSPEVPRTSPAVMTGFFLEGEENLGEEGGGEGDSTEPESGTKETENSGPSTESDASSDECASCGDSSSSSEVLSYEDSEPSADKGLESEDAPVSEEELDLTERDLQDSTSIVDEESSPLEDAEEGSEGLPVVDIIPETPLAEDSSPGSGYDEVNQNAGETVSEESEPLLQHAADFNDSKVSGEGAELEPLNISELNLTDDVGFEEEENLPGDNMLQNDTESNLSESGDVNGSASGSGELPVELTEEPGEELAGDSGVLDTNLSEPPGNVSGEVESQRILLRIDYILLLPKQEIPSQENLTGLAPENDTFINQTLQNETPELLNETNETFLINETALLNDTEFPSQEPKFIVESELIQGEVLLGHPVSWKKIIKLSNPSNQTLSEELLLEVPADALEVRVFLNGDEIPYEEPMGVLVVSEESALVEVEFETAPLEVELFEDEILLSEVLPPEAENIEVFERGQRKHVFRTRLDVDKRIVLREKKLRLSQKSSLPYQNVSLNISDFFGDLEGKLEVGSGNNAFLADSGPGRDRQILISEISGIKDLPEQAEGRPEKKSPGRMSSFSEDPGEVLPSDLLENGSQENFTGAELVLVPGGGENGTVVISLTGQAIQGRAAVGEPVTWNLSYESLQVLYETSAPSTEVKTRSGGILVRVFSNVSMHYQNVSASVALPNSASQPKIYHLRDGVRVEVTTQPEYSVDYLDQNNDSLYDLLVWDVPQLSEQEFEIDLVILNVQSYPIVGLNWTVMFNTTGTANLTITAVDGTTWTNFSELSSDESPEYGYDLKFLELRCGDEPVAYGWQGDSVFVENYSCNSTGFETSKVLSAGKHDIEFKFGEVIAYAHNNALTEEPWCYDGSGYDCKVNCTHRAYVCDNQTWNSTCRIVMYDRRGYCNDSTALESTIDMTSCTNWDNPEACLQVGTLPNYFYAWAHHQDQGSSTSLYMNTTDNMNGDTCQGHCECKAGQSRWAIGGETASTNCCGDDASEYRIVSNYGTGMDGSPDNTDACCTASNKCVDNGSCYSSTASFDADGDGDTDYCNAGTWVDCNSAANCPSGMTCSSNNCV
ncbi:MAG: hypothetical protein JW727_02810 [Candidatus Aenigmarchaeota archaeon]|nr:hypothetical protein [Candidatus Aenigmarchaeota archaeon]